MAAYIVVLLAVVLYSGAVAVITIRPLLPYALAFAAGAMIFVVVEEVIPESQRGENTDVATLAAIAGFRFGLEGLLALVRVGDAHLDCFLSTVRDRSGRSFRRRHFSFNWLRRQIH